MPSAWIERGSLRVFKNLAILIPLELGQGLAADKKQTVD